MLHQRMINSKSREGVPKYVPPEEEPLKVASVSSTRKERYAMQRDQYKKIIFVSTTYANRQA